MDKNYIPIIFGLKIKQLRNERDLSPDDLAKSANLSKSYLNEIEKGKKYPKSDKILALSQALEVDYNELVSLKLYRKFAPIGDLLEKGILKEIPLHLFGIDEKNLIDIIAEAPDKVTAFISTLFELATHYNLNKEAFYLAALRSFQELNGNYFEWIEKKGVACLKNEFLGNELTLKNLSQYLIDHCDYNISYLPFENENSNIKHLRSIYIPGKKLLLINKNTSPDQVKFILAKEVGYCYLKLTNRVNTFTWAKFDNFDQLLNNFYASYFAGSILIPANDLVKKLERLFQNKTWDSEKFNELILFYNQSTETFYHRLTNILPHFFNLKELFFMRLVHTKGTEKYVLNKELHLSQNQSPHAVEVDEHYCREWVSVKVIQQMEKLEGDIYTDCQYSVYPQYDNKKYWVVATATPDPFRPENIRSVAIGFLEPGIKGKIKIAADKSIPYYQVDITCEGCPIENCSVRAVEPYRYLDKVKKQKVIDAAQELTDKYK